MYTELNKHLIVVLVVFYLLFNVYIGKYYNILVFILMFSVLNNFIKDKMTLLIGIYCLIISLSIVKHFHLLENFESSPTTELPTPTKPTQRINKRVLKHKKGRTIKSDYKDIIEELSDHLIMKYVEKTKQDSPSDISTRKVKMTDLIPTKAELSSAKIKGISSDKVELNKPIIITNDNFIIDGHHRWYIHKSKNKASSISENSDNDFMSCTIINSSINKFLKKITTFKREYNSKTLDNFQLDKNKINETQKAITSIKKNMNIIEKYNKELNKLNII